MRSVLLASTACLGALSLLSLGLDTASWLAWVGLVVFGLVGIAFGLDVLIGQDIPEVRFRVQWDARMLSCSHPLRPTEEVAWNDVVQVSVVRTAGGPGCPRVWVLVHGRDGRGVSLPVGAPGSEELVARLSELPGFDQGSLRRAAAAAERSSHACWRGDGVDWDAVCI